MKTKCFKLVESNKTNSKKQAKDRFRLSTKIEPELGLKTFYRSVESEMVFVRAKGKMYQT